MSVTKTLLVEDDEMNRDMLSRRLIRRGYEVVIATASIPIIALTAHAMAGDKEKALEAGCDELDTKGVELSRLLEQMGG